METESHAVTHVKKESAGQSAVLGPWDSGSQSLSCLIFTFDIAHFTLHYILASKAEIHQK